MASRGGKSSNAIVWRHAEALMYMAVLLQLLGAACALAPGQGRFRRPEGGEDGLYQGFVDENGETQVKYLGKPDNATTTRPSPSVDPRGFGGPGRKLLDTGVHCQGNALDWSESNYATGCLAGYFANGGSFSSWTACFWGKAVAYGCDYGNSQYPSSGQIWSDGDAISSVCGGYNNAGWYAHESWKSSYGRCPGNWGFC